MSLDFFLPILSRGFVGHFIQRVIVRVIIYKDINKKLKINKQTNI